MDAHALGARHLALLGRATGNAVFASIVFRTILEDLDLDVRLLRNGRDYVVIATEILGNQVLAEQVMPVVWDDLDDGTRLGVLRVYVTQMLRGHKRWRGTMNRRLLALGIAMIPAPPTTSG